VEDIPKSWVGSKNSGTIPKQSPLPSKKENLPTSMKYRRSTRKNKRTFRICERRLEQDRANSFVRGFTKVTRRERRVRGYTRKRGGLGYRAVLKIRPHPRAEGK